MIDALLALAHKPERRIVGLMSGTSLDGIDAAVIRVRGAGLATEAHLERFECMPFEPQLRTRLERAASGDPMPAAEHARLHFAIAESFAGAALGVVRAACLSPADIDAIGSHGQTLFHHAPAGGVWSADNATWQAGSLPVIAARTGIVTIGDFRSADVALGGTGAPLVPYVDFLLRRSATESRILLNLGGIANLTYLPANCSPDDVLAWDVGPANMVLDGVARARLGLDRDPDGAHAARGHADTAWVEELLAAEYFARPAPKSAGREQFGLQFVAGLLGEAERRGRSTEDLLATAVELTARSVALACEQPPIAARADTLFVAGGGRRNPTLVRRLEACVAPLQLRGFETLGVDSDAKEAFDFAILANESLHGHAGNLPSVTGASRSCILGSIAMAGSTPAALGAPRAAS